MSQPTPARLTWPDIRARATAFAREWTDGASERAEAQTFWNEFLAVFGVHRRRAQAPKNDRGDCADVIASAPGMLGSAAPTSRYEVSRC